jgi:hypothetical protein
VSKTMQATIKTRLLSVISRLVLLVHVHLT